MIPDTILAHLLTFLASFILIWAGAGLIINEVTSLARSFKMSFFTLSFFLLGILTSLPEISIGTTAILSNEPEIFIGNLIGGVIVMFLLIIPLLAIIGGKVNFPKQLSRPHLAYALLVVITPSLLISDRRVTPWEGLLAVLMYVVLFLLLFKKSNMFEKITTNINHSNHHALIRLIKTSLGIILLLLSSNIIVNSTEYFANLFGWSPFLVSLLLVSIGTNIPELSLVFRSILQKRQDIALADYIGSAAANTLLFGLFMLIVGGTVVIPNHFLQRFIFLTVGLILFFMFVKSKNSLSRSEGFAMLAVYLAFFMLELYTAV